MTAEEFQTALVRFGFTQEGFALALGYSGRTGQMWARGDSAVPGAVSVVLRLLIARPELVGVLADIAPMVLAQKRSAAGRAPRASSQRKLNISTGT